MGAGETAAALESAVICERAASAKTMGSPDTPELASASATIFAVKSAAWSGDIVNSSNGDSSTVASAATGLGLAGAAATRGEDRLTAGFFWGAADFVPVAVLFTAAAFGFVAYALGKIWGKRRSEPENRC